jgi:hypothetical protein
VLDEAEFAECITKIAKIEGRDEDIMIAEFIDALKEDE